MSSSNSFSDYSMIELFRIEAETHSSALSHGLLELETEGVTDSGLEQLMRAAHSIKGAARIVQLGPVVELAHAMEDWFEQARQGSNSITHDKIDILLQATDLLKKLSTLSSADIESYVQEHQVKFAQQASSIVALVHSSPEPSPQPEPVNEKQPEPPSTVSTSGQEESFPQKQKAPKAHPASQVRVESDTLGRLMNLSGMSIVQSRWLRPFSNQLLRTRRDQATLIQRLETLRSRMTAQSCSPDLLFEVDEILPGMEQQFQQVDSNYTEFEEYARRAVQLNNQLYQETISSRMRPFHDGVHGFHRLVRDVSHQLGKQARLVIRGEHTRVDRDILESLEAPLTQLIRNCLDHGLETPDERTRMGKKPEGKIIIDAWHHAGMLQVSVQDDGRGIQLESIRERIIDRKLTDPEMAAQLSDQELIEFLFLPGFTTRKNVTELSGRGVGLDVVRSMVQSVHGAVQGEINPDGGFTVCFRLPQTLSVVRCLLLELNNEVYAIPLSRIDTIIRVARQEIRQLEGRQYLDRDGKSIGLVSARQILELPNNETIPDELTVLELSQGNTTYGLVIDKLHDESRIVVRPLDPRLGKVPDVSAVGLMRDGGLCLILDPDDLFRSIDTLLHRGQLRSVISGEQTPVERPRKRILVVDDSLTVREVERRLLEHHEYQVEVAVDGVDGINALRKSRYDLVITDIDMPRMNGFELVRHVRGDPSLRSLPIMIVSYKDREEDRMKGLDAGANYYLTKSSFHDETLLDAVVDLIGKARE